MAYVSPHRAPHQAFAQPDQGTLKVWRYLDLAKFVSLLASGRLFFARLDTMKDPFEGAATRAAYDQQQLGADAERQSALRRQMRQDIHVNCWHANHGESEAMWQLYCGPGEGVAVQTTYEKLDRSLPGFALLGKVNYADYEAGAHENAEHLLTAIMCKRDSFEHEREVRAVIRYGEVLAKGPAAAQGITELPNGLEVEWNIPDVIEHVCVSPYAAGWYRETVHAVLQKFAPALADRLRWSEMKSAPLF